jgi:hypothetical protein
VIALDPQTRMLSAQITLPPERWEERFVDVLAAALLEGAITGDVDAALEALGAWTGTAIARGQLVSVFTRFSRLAAAARTAAREAGADAEKLVARTMFDATRLAEVLDKVRASAGLAPPSKPGGLGEADGPISSTDSTVAAGIERVLELTEDASAFESAILHWTSNPDPRISAALFTYLKRWVPGREGKLGPVIEREAPAFALAALELLKDSTSKDASLAVAAGLKSSHAEVRRAALRSQKGEEGQAELLRLLSDPEADLRCEVLGIIGQLRLRAVGAAIVRRASGSRACKS